MSKGFTVKEFNTDVVWRDIHGRDWKPRELEKSHLANIIYHLMQYPTKFERVTFEAMIAEAARRGLTQEYLAPDST